MCDCSHNCYLNGVDQTIANILCFHWVLAYCYWAVRITVNWIWYVRIHNRLKYLLWSCSYRSSYLRSLWLGHRKVLYCYWEIHMATVNNRAMKIHCWHFFRRYARVKLTLHLRRKHMDCLDAPPNAQWNSSNFLCSWWAPCLFRFHSTYSRKWKENKV